MRVHLRQEPLPQLRESPAGASVVSLNGAKVEAWAFSPNNVLSWEDGAGHTAWLLFMSLSGGPIIMGNVLKPDQAPPSGTNLPALYTRSLYLPTCGSLHS